MTSSERMAEDAAKIATMDQQGATAAKRRLKDEINDTQVQLDKARAEETEHFRSEDRFDVFGERPVPVEGTWHFWKGSDWTSEEKRELNTAWSTLGLGTLASIGAILNAVFSLHAAASAEDAGHARIEEAGDNTTSATNQNLLDTAAWGFDSAIVNTTMVGGAGLTALATGIRDYRRACVKHAERLASLNRPEETERRENLENYINGLQERLAKVRERLTALAQQADVEKGNLIEVITHVQNHMSSSSSSSST
ncbi:hypothetical protein [Actinophytocola glycyrrhizae]|uniref:SLATT domain-containing protein n=1 Tax=Actinophytocola glycyrrhizae TaxID=2044873 RepID=A0ABV9S8F7_9PSEU